MAVVSPPASLVGVNYGLEEGCRNFSQVVGQVVHHVILADIFAILHLPSNPGQKISSIGDILRLIVAD